MLDLDYNGDGEINFTEFIAATIDWEDYFTQENLKVTFDNFDTEGNGLLTAKSISTSFIWASRYIDEATINEMI